MEQKEWWSGLLIQEDNVQNNLIFGCLLQCGICTHTVQSRFIKYLQLCETAWLVCASLWNITTTKSLVLAKQERWILDFHNPGKRQLHGKPFEQLYSTAIPVGCIRRSWGHGHTQLDCFPLGRAETCCSAPQKFGGISWKMSRRCLSDPFQTSLLISKLVANCWTSSISAAWEAICFIILVL